MVLSGCKKSLSVGAGRTGALQLVVSVQQFELKRSGEQPAYYSDGSFFFSPVSKFA